GARGGWDSHLVAEYVAARLAPGSRRLAAGEHLHHLVRPARGRLRLGQGSQLVRDRHGHPQAQERDGDGGRSGCRREKNLIEAAYTQEGVPVWAEDEAGPSQTMPYPGSQWHPAGQPVRHPHEYVRRGTAKQLTLFHPARGTVRVKGVRSAPNSVLHPWLQAELAAILAALPEPVVLPAEENRQRWERWQDGLQVRITLPQELPPLRLLLVLDNLTGHYSVDFVLWLFAHGIMPLYTPLSGSWLNMAESIQRILKRRALDGPHPQTPEEVIAWLEAAARGWNSAPTPVSWDGKRRARRERARQRRHRLGGSGACTHQPLTKAA